MGKSQRTKGHSWERKVASDMRSVGFEKARRALEYHPDDAKGVDLQDTGKFDVQCKALKIQPGIPAVMKEIKGKPEQIPVIVFKIDNRGSYAAFKYEDALMLMSLFHKTCH